MNPQSVCAQSMQLCMHLNLRGLSCTCLMHLLMWEPMKQVYLCVATYFKTRHSGRLPTFLPPSSPAGARKRVRTAVASCLVPGTDPSNTHVVSPLPGSGLKSPDPYIIHKGHQHWLSSAPPQKGAHIRSEALPFWRQKLLLQFPWPFFLISGVPWPESHWVYSEETAFLGFIQKPSSHGSLSFNESVFLFLSLKSMHSCSPSRGWDVSKLLKTLLRPHVL